MKKIFLISSFFFCFITSHGQTFDWVKSVGSVANYVYGYDLAVDDSGYIYVVGDFNGTHDFDPGLGVYDMTAFAANIGDHTIFILKLDSLGNFKWACKMGSSYESNHGSSITVDDAGNVYTTGKFFNNVDFDPSPSSTYVLSGTSNGDAFVQKLDLNGNFVWAVNAGGTSTAEGYAIELDLSGNPVLTGTFSLTVDFDPGLGNLDLTSNGSSDAFIQKLDQSGNLIWAIGYGGIGNDSGIEFGIDSLGSIILLGEFRNTVDFDNGAGVFNLSSTGLTDIYVLKVDSLANFVWAVAIGESGNNDNGESLKLDPSGNVYFCGLVYDDVDFDPGSGTYIPLHSGGQDAFVEKLDSSGNFLWAALIGGTGNDQANTLELDKDGNVFSLGDFTGNIDFDPGPGTFMMGSSGVQNYIQKLDSLGNFVGAGKFNINSFEAIEIDTAGNFFIAGYVGGSNEFDPDPITIFELPNTASPDLFVLKLNGKDVCSEQLQSAIFPEIACSLEVVSGEIPDAIASTLVTWEIAGVLMQNGPTLNWIADTTGTFDLNISVKNTFCSMDSTVQLIIYPGVPVQILNPLEICPGDSILIFDQYQSQEMIYFDTLQSFNGCDSVLAIELVLLPQIPILILDTALICQGDSILIFGQYQSLTGIYNDTLQSINGCDSILARQLDVWTIQPVNFDTMPDTLCTYSGAIIVSGSPSGGIFSGNGISLNQFDPGIAGQGVHSLYYTYVDSNGCIAIDSISMQVDDCLGDMNMEIEEIYVYPNPFSEYTIIYFNQSAQHDYFISVHDFLGRVVYTNNHNSSDNLNIYRDNLTSGVYILSVIDINNIENRYSMKLVVK